MAIAYRSISTISYASRTNTTLSLPAGVADGDILAGVIFTGSAAGYVTPTLPTGFTLIDSNTVTDGTSFKGNFAVCWKRASGESSSYTFTHTAASSQAYMLCYSGCLASGSPVDVYSKNTDPTAGVSTALSITTSVANTELLYLEHDWSGSGTLTPPSSFTERFDGLVYAADKANTPSGASGNALMNNGGAPWSAYLVALLPATGLTFYTLTAVIGSYAVTGIAANELIAYNLTSSTGVVVLSGNAANLLSAYLLTSSSVTFAITGIAVNLVYTPFFNAYTLTAAPGAFAVTGVDAGLVYLAIAHYVLICGMGMFYISGWAVTGGTSGMGIPVKTIPAGGTPVVDVSSTSPKTGTPVTETADGSGLPVTKVPTYGMPVVYV